MSVWFPESAFDAELIRHLARVHFESRRRSIWFPRGGRPVSWAQLPYEHQRRELDAMREALRSLKPRAGLW